MIHTFSLKDKIILITGGYGYLGKAITESLVFHGGVVYVLGKNKNKFLQTFTNDIRDRGKLFFQLCDVSSTDSVSSAFKTIYRKTKKVDVLINNAAYSKGRSPEKITDEELRVGIDGNLGSVYRCIREIIPYFKNDNSGKIINVSSMYGIVSPDFTQYQNCPDFISAPHYGAAKAGVIQLTKYFASYLGKFNITINSVSPGPFPTKKIQKNKGFIEELRKRTCLNRIGSSEDIAGAFVFLASNASNFMTGQNLVVDGGWTIK